MRHQDLHQRGNGLRPQPLVEHRLLLKLPSQPSKPIRRQDHPQRLRPLVEKRGGARRQPTRLATPEREPREVAAPVQQRERAVGPGVPGRHGSLRRPHDGGGLGPVTCAIQGDDGHLRGLAGHLRLAPLAAALHQDLDRRGRRHLGRRGSLDRERAGVPGDRPVLLRDARRRGLGDGGRPGFRGEGRRHGHQRRRNLRHSTFAQGQRLRRPVQRQDHRPGEEHEPHPAGGEDGQPLHREGGVRHGETSADEQWPPAACAEVLVTHDGLPRREAPSPAPGSPH